MSEKRSGKMPTHESVWKEYEKGLGFNTQINLYDTVETNENFFIGKQWEGVQANGLPTPVFNFLKRVTLFSVASITSDNLKMQASPLAATSEQAEAQRAADVVNNEFERLFEENKIVNLLREYMRNAAVDGDGCLYTHWDADAPNGQKNLKGKLVTEILQNTQVFFGNPNERNPQKQPYIILETHEICEDVRDRAKENGCKDWQGIKVDNANTRAPIITDDKVTVLTRLWRDKKTKTLWCCECTKDSMVREPFDMGTHLYPINWLNWDYVQHSYHGQGLITGLIPNQIFINKLFAMSMISLMTTAYPKIVYDKTRVGKWDNRVGAAIGINGGDVNSVAKIIDPAQISPQIAQFIELAVNYTQTFLGATPAALGDTRPDNTSAIIALQRAASTPSEITKQNLYQSLEDLGKIYMDFMAEYYGTRDVFVHPPKELGAEVLQFAGVTDKVPTKFDFETLKDMHFTLKLDVGASAYWSEIASMQTLDNLLMQGKIDVVDYLERVPAGYITKKEELVEKLKGLQGIMSQMQGVVGGGGSSPALPGSMEIPTGRGNGGLQRALTESAGVA